MADANVLDLLRAHQDEHKYTDRKMAEHLGIPTVTWRRTKAGDIRVGATILRAAMKEHIITAAQAGKQLLEEGNGSAAPEDLPFDKRLTITAGATK